jgi:hypothetical protein
MSTVTARRRLAALLPALLVATLAARSAAAQGAPFGTNLIVNGNAEGGAGSATGNDVLPVPGWTTTGAFTVVRYAAGNGFPGAASPGPADRGANFFSGGPARASSSARQVIDLADFGGLLPQVAAGAVRFTLAGYFGGFEGQDDAASLTARFLAVGGSVVGSVMVGPVYARDRGNVTGLFARSLDGVLPVNTRLVEFTLDMAHGEGAYDDGYADNLSFTLASGATATVPEPSTWALVGTGLAGVLGGAARRRRPAPAA